MSALSTCELRCPNCGAPHRVAATIVSFACVHCGVSIRVQSDSGTMWQLPHTISCASRGTDKSAAELTVVQGKSDFDAARREIAAIHAASERKQRILLEISKHRQVVKEYQKRPFRSFFSREAKYNIALSAMEVVQAIQDDIYPDGFMTGNPQVLNDFEDYVCKCALDNLARLEKNARANLERLQRRLNETRGRVGVAQNKPTDGVLT